MKNLAILIPIMLAASIATAQVKTATLKKGVVIKKEVQVVKPKKEASNILIDLGKSGPVSTELNKQGVRAFASMETKLDGTTIRTTISPVNAIQTSSSIVKSSKPRDKGTTEKNGRICKSYSVTLSPESESFDAPLADKMSFTYPGAAYNYNDYIKNNTSPPMNKSERNPIILQVSAASSTGDYILLEQPDHTTLNKAVGTLKYGIPAQANNLSTEIYVQSIVNNASFALNVEAGGGGFGFSANASLGVSYDSKKTYMSIDAKQKNYVITANRPDRAEGGFYKDAAENANTENVYMSSVTYGRRVIGVIETELDEQNMEMALQASYNGFGASANLGLGVIDKVSSGKTSVRLLFVGGKGDVITIPNPTQASVKAAIDKWMVNTDAQAAVPIEYTFRNMNDIGMRWESVTDNINYEQCVPIPSAPKPWDISFTLNYITNNKGENVKLGVSQSVGVQTFEGWKNENSGLNVPIICWMQDWAGCQIPPDIDFRQQYWVGTTRSYTISNDEYQENPLVRIDTKRIVTYRTSAGGSKNAEDQIPKYDLRLMDMGDSKTFDVPVHVNGRIFKFNYRVTSSQKQ